MAIRRQQDPLDRPIPPPATTLEGRNDQLIAAAFDLVEKRIHNGTASAQETVHFLKLGSSLNRLQEEKVRKEALMLEVRAEEMKNRNNGEELMERALAAFRGYSGEEPVDVEPDY